MIGICARRTWASLGLFLSVSLLGGTGVSAAPQAVKPAEEAAIRLVIAHLMSGPAALGRHLDVRSMSDPVTPVAAAPAPVAAPAAAITKLPSC